MSKVDAERSVQRRRGRTPLDVVAVVLFVAVVLLVASVGWPSRSFDLGDRPGATPASIPSAGQQRLDLSCQDGWSSVADIAVEVEQAM